MSRYRDALQVREFRAIFVAHIASMTGAVTANFALTILVYSRTQSPLLAALVFTLVLAPHLIAGTLLSALIDRVPSRLLMVSCNLTSATLVIAMSLGGTPVAAVLLLAFLLGLIEPVFAGTRAASLPDILPGAAYVPGRSLMRLVIQGAQMGGFALGGLLLTVFSPATMLHVNAACFLFSALILRFGTRERRPLVDETAPAKPSLLRDSVSGISAVWRLPAVRRVLLLGWAVPAFGVMPEAMAVPYTARLGAGAVGAGLLLTAIPLGTVAGEILCNWLVPPEWQQRLIAPLAAVVFTPMLLFVFRPPLAASFGILVLCGLGFAIQLGQDRLMLAVVPEGLRARTLSIQMAGLMTWQGLGFAIAGAAALVIPPAIVIVVAGVCGLISVAVTVPRGALQPAMLGPNEARVG